MIFHTRTLTKPGKDMINQDAKAKPHAMANSFNVAWTKDAKKDNIKRIAVSTERGFHSLLTTLLRDSLIETTLAFLGIPKTRLI